MSKKTLIKHLENDVYCRIGISKIKGAGVGVIAIKNIPKHTSPFKNLSKEKDKIIDLNENDIKNLNSEVKKIIKDFFGTGNKYDVLAAGPNYINISYYLNHSATPNLDIVESKESEYLTFITNRNIKAGEELTIDYSKYE
jgi:SET domain-containing protein